MRLTQKPVISSEARSAQSRYLLIIKLLYRSLHSLRSVEMTEKWLLVSLILPQILVVIKEIQ